MITAWHRSSWRDYASGLDETGQDYGRRVVNGARRMDALINNLLEYARMGRQEIELEPIALARAIEDARAGLGNEIQARGASVSVEETTARVLANGTLLEQVISNLLENAIKYVAHCVTPRVHVQIKENGDRVRLEVLDNGIGVAPEQRGKIFHIFQRLHSEVEYPGTGLGLAILAKAVRGMGGAFGVEPAPEGGSCFWVELRRAGA